MLEFNLAKKAGGALPAPPAEGPAGSGEGKKKKESRGRDQDRGRKE